MFNVDLLHKRLTPAHIGLTAWLPDYNKPKKTPQLVIKETPDQGKYYVAAKPLLPGEIVLKEEPLIRQLNKAQWKDHCFTCFRPVTKKTLVQCHVKTCRWNIVFCSGTCEKKGWSTGHAWLCRFPELQELQQVVFAFMGYITCRSQGLENLFDLANSDPNKTTPLHDELKLLGTLFFLKDMSMLVEILSQIKCNAFAIKQAASVAVDSSLVVSRESIHLGQAVYLSASRFNHSCDPSSLAVFGSDGHPCQIQVQMIKPVKPGEEVNISYGPLATKHSRKDRQQKLLDDYFFTCECVSCKDTSKITVDSKYKCQICRKGRLYRQQSQCESCEQTPHWPYFLSTEAKIEAHTERHEFIQTLQLQETIYHDDVLAIGETLDKLAQVYCMHGNMKVAASYSKRSLEVTQKVYGRTSVEAAEEMMKLSTLLFNSMQKSEALRQIKETIVLYRILGLDKSAPEDIEELEELQNHLLYIVR
ncbi:hypothetical protein INT47_011010 [Mucor saturninus]|uniref:SET domain-containing protein n=1 Tax=Mucor saturninus TaxID=64648 RepID=A0A8H7RE72_9FUNG|nr:hypothetical protein INT47_011010 [Mucor saturninus]